MSTYLSEATAREAERTINVHTAEVDGWRCSACWRHHSIIVKAGCCNPYVRAADYLRDYWRQSRRRPAQPAPATRPPAGRVWP
jgi:hypothetical protein